MRFSVQILSMKFLLYFLFIGLNLSISFAQVPQEEIPKCEDGIKQISAKNDSAKLQGYEFVEFIISSCDQSASLTNLDRISKIEKIKDTLIYHIQFKKLCCSISQAEISIVQYTLNFITNEYDEICDYCFCTCCYTAIYKIKTSHNPELFAFNGEPIEFSEIGKPESTEKITYWDNGNKKERIMMHGRKVIRRENYNLDGKLYYRVVYDLAGNVISERCVDEQ